jgi:hypothetical protein
MKLMPVDYQVFMSSMPRADGVGNGERMWKHSPQSWGMQALFLLVR